MAILVDSGPGAMAGGIFDNVAGAKHENLEPVNPPAAHGRHAAL